jgi:predicted ATP-dependent endonuclease of OLD family
METTRTITNPSSPLKSFSIFGLFGKRDVNLMLDKNVKVLIGENGSGKTSVLNALYYTLTGKFNRLNSIVFDRLIVQFISGQTVEIKKEDIAFFEEDERWSGAVEERVVSFILKELPESEKQLLFDTIKSPDKAMRENVIKRIIAGMHRVPYPAGIIRRGLYAFLEGKTGRVEEQRAVIRKELSEEIMYFPTYRRIEEELQNLGTGKVELSKDDKRLIQFGMQDVKDTFIRVIQSINKSSIDGFSKMTGELLSQYVDGVPESIEGLQDRIKPDTLQIILERVGENIAPAYKIKIMELVTSRDLFTKEEQYKYLVNFLTNLIKIYDQQKMLDNSIKNFTNVCNGYLIGKKVVYNESKVTISVIQTKDDQEIELKNLSSGEKQIISLFAKIYLEVSKNTIVLFDEPELSLSIEWQKKLLPDIMRSSKCNLLLAVTHSPFIFDNEFDMAAEPISKYMVEH